ncbi:MAG: VanW family protein, partial [Roseiflexaceae bacterium]|nr:VanW family protein [Roseiflexaceae bacterium]
MDSFVLEVFVPGTPPRLSEQLRLLLNTRLLACSAPLALSLVLAACGTQRTSQIDPTAVPTATIVTTPTVDVAPTVAAARDALAKRPLTLTFAGKRWQPTAEQLGATITAENNQLQVVVDQARLRTYLQQIGSKIGIAPVDAQVQAAVAGLVATPAKAGRVLDLESTQYAATNALESATARQLVLQVVEATPAIDDADAAAAIERANELMASPFVMILPPNKQPFTWDAEVLLPMLRFTPERGMLEAGLDRDRLAERVALFAERTEKKVLEPRVAWNNGDLKIVGPVRVGARVDAQKMIDALIGSFTGSTRELTLSTRPLQPTITEAKLGTLGIKELVSIGKSDFSESAPYRVTNVLAGMKLLDGVLIPPGEEFSFNNTIGEIDAANGFVEGYAIIQNRTQLEFGGGICQDSTTVFRAAFWAGLPISDRKQHTFYISWYDKYGLGPQGDGPGLDAAIFTGVQDLKFVNDTGAWLLMQATANPRNGLAEVALYGTKPDRTVSLTHEIIKRTPAIDKPEYVPDPKQPVGTVKRTDTARGGMVIEVYRTVVDGGVERPRELFSTNFQPWPNKYTVNPADIGPDGRPVFLNPPPAPTVDPLLPTADPNAPPMPTADPNAPPMPTADP